MKKINLLLLSILLSFSFSNAQNNVSWEEVALSVGSGNAPYVLNLMDDFYSSIEMPEDTSVSLEAIYHSPQGSPTHIINFIGPVEGLIELRALRSGDAYDAYNSGVGKFATILSIKGGKTLARIPGSDDEVFGAQEWSFNVKDQGKFGDAFLELMEVFKPTGYVSLGAYTHGERGETHYIYMMYKDQAAMLDFGPKTEAEGKAFEKFFSKTMTISDYNGSRTTVPVKTWN
jgi:hypothetical protein